MSGVVRALAVLGGFVIALILVGIVVFHSILGNYKVEGSAMAPTLHNGDFVIVDKLSYRSSSPARGDVVVFTQPTTPTLPFIKRVVGVPGDIVKLRIVQDRLQAIVNSRVVRQATLSLGERGDLTGCGSGTCTFTVPPDHIFVLGDNLTNSLDSREFGAVADEQVVGRVWFTYWHSKT